MANEGTEESKGLPEKQEPTQEKTSDVQKSTSLPSKGPTTDPSKSPQKNNNNNNNNAKSDTASSSQSKPSTPSSTKLSKGAASIDKYNDLKKETHSTNTQETRNWQQIIQTRRHNLPKGIRLF